MIEPSDEYAPVPLDGEDSGAQEALLDPPAPARPMEPPKPLPRLYKSAPPPEEESPEPAPRKKRKSLSEEPQAGKKSRRGSVDPDDEGAGKLVEATPALETYEGRKYARMIVGAVIVGVLGIIGLVIANLGNPSAPNQAPGSAADKSGGPSAASKPSQAQRERESRSMFEHAREVAQAGNIDEAVGLLERLESAYPNTKAAEDAAEALDRRERRQPLFVSGAVVKADVVVEREAAPSVGSEKPEVLPSERPTAGKDPIIPDTHVSRPKDVRVVAPGAGAEPHRDTGLSLPTAEIEPRRLPQGFLPRLQYGVHTSGWPVEIVSAKDGSVMVLIPGGSFRMGRDDGKPEERPAHLVTLNPYYMDQHEVTVRQFKRALASGGVALEGDAAAELDLESRSDDSPITNIKYVEALAYSKWTGKRLPTEAQWEFAARTTDGRRHPWGDPPANWSKPRAPRQIDRVMSFGSDLSPYSVFDLAGNAWEWTSDWFDASWYARLKGRNTLEPTGPSAGRERQRSVRGGSPNWLAAWRSGVKEDSRIPYLGFRCVLPLGGGSGGPGPNPAGGPNGPQNLKAGPGGGGGQPF